MSLLTVHPAIADRFVRAICFTLLHSLWQGLLLAIAGGLIVMGTRKVSPARRYNLLLGALVLFFLISAATFTSLYSRDQRLPAGAAPFGNATVLSTNPVSLSGNSVSNSTNKTLPASPDNAAAARQPISVISRDALSASAGSIRAFPVTLSEYFDRHRDGIVLVWFFLIGIKGLQLSLTLRRISRLRKLKITLPDFLWTERTWQLAARLGIGRPVSLLESGLVSAPMMIGYLKPLILIPIGLLSKLPPAEVEAILIHELAHIRRQDYLANLFQSFFEILFFFNPAVNWVSQLIRTEREYCCDDLTLAQTGNKADYISALVSCEEHSPAIPIFALAFPGQQRGLMHRVQRIVTDRNHSLNMMEKTFLTICLSLSGLCILAFTHKNRLIHLTQAVVRALPVSLPGSNDHPLTKARLSINIPPVVNHKSDLSDTTPARLLETPKLQSLQPLQPLQPLQSAGSPNQPAPLSPLITPALLVADSTSSLHLSSPAFSSPGLLARVSHDSGIARVAALLIRKGLVKDPDHWYYKLNNEELIIDSLRQSEPLHEEVLKLLQKKPDDKIKILFSHNYNVKKN